MKRDLACIALAATLTFAAPAVIDWRHGLGAPTAALNLVLNRESLLPTGKPEKPYVFKHSVEAFAARLGAQKASMPLVSSLQEAATALHAIGVATSSLTGIPNGLALIDTENGPELSLGRRGGAVLVWDIVHNVAKEVPVTDQDAARVHALIAGSWLLR